MRSRHLRTIESVDALLITFADDGDVEHGFTFESRPSFLTYWRHVLTAMLSITVLELPMECERGNAEVSRL